MALIIKEYGAGNVYMGSQSFPETPQGYAQARQAIEQANAKGHTCRNDDSGRVMNYTRG